MYVSVHTYSIIFFYATYSNNYLYYEKRGKYTHVLHIIVIFPNPKRGKWKRERVRGGKLTRTENKRQARGQAQKYVLLRGPFREAQMAVPCEKGKEKILKSQPCLPPSVIQDQEEMAAPQHVRAAPLARALRASATATATATVSASAPAPAPIKSQGTSRRALLGLSEPQLRQLALDLGEVPDPDPMHCTRGRFCLLRLPYLPAFALSDFWFRLHRKATGASSCTTSSTNQEPSKSKISTTVGVGPGQELSFYSCKPPVCTFASLNQPTGSV